MAISSIGMGTQIQVQSEFKAPEVDYIPKPEAKVTSIMKMQAEIVEMQNQSNFIKQTEDTTQLWKYNLVSKLNII